MDTTAICLARKSGTSFSELARVSGKSETEVRRIIATNKKKGKPETKLAVVREIEENTDEATEINSLHKEICGVTLTVLEKAVRVGELLVAQKAKLPHGGWLPWIKSNLKFSDKTAETYIKCFRNRDRINSKSASILTIKDLVKADKSKVSEPKLSKKAKSLTFTHAVENKTVVVKDPPRSWMVAHRGKNLGSPDIIVCRKCHEYTQGGLGMMGAITGLIVSCECGNSTRQAEEVEE